jgi:hypothetical protein
VLLLLSLTPAGGAAAAAAAAKTMVPQSQSAGQLVTAVDVISCGRDGKRHQQLSS